MKLLRYGSRGQEKPGVLDSKGGIGDLSKVVPDIAGSSLTPESVDRLRNLNANDLLLVTGSPRIGSCVGQVGKFICIGLNNSDHAAEAGIAVPADPIVFMKATSAIIGPNDDVTIPWTTVHH